MTSLDTLKQAAQALRDTKPELAAALEAMAGQPKQYSTAVKWPDGYCLDPNGVMCCPAGMHEAWSFGYDLGYADALTVRAAPIATPEHDAKVRNAVNAALEQAAKTAEREIIALEDCIEEWEAIAGQILQRAAKNIRSLKSTGADHAK